VFARLSDAGRIVGWLLHGAARWFNRADAHVASAVRRKPRAGGSDRRFLRLGTVCRPRRGFRRLHIVRNSEAPMAWTQADVDTLKAAIATGARRVRFGAGPDAREVEYRSLEEMNRALGQMLGEISPASEQPMRTVGEFHSGLMPARTW